MYLCLTMHMATHTAMFDFGPTITLTLTCTYTCIYALLCMRTHPARFDFGPTITFTLPELPLKCI